MRTHPPSAVERAAAGLAAYLAGERPDSHAEGARLRQLGRRVERWIATRQPDAGIWQAVRQTPWERVGELTELVARMVREDVLAHHLVTRLAPSPRARPWRNITYLDFVVAVHGGGDGRGDPWASLLKAPLGDRCREPLHLPTDWLRPEVVHRFGARVLDPRGGVSWSLAGASPPPTAEELGEGLFRALFAGGLRDAWNECSGLLRGRPDLGLRLRLGFDLKTPRGRTLATLPWETLRDPATGSTLAKSHRTPVVRSLGTEGPSQVRPPRPMAPRILLVGSRPEGPRKLEVESETWSIEEAWRSVPGVEVKGLRGDLAAIREQLRAGSYQVLHYMGHGVVDEQTREGALVLEGEDRRPVRVLSSLLVDHLADVSPFLVVLSACHSGELPRFQDAEPFSGLAAALLRAGIPAVVAMQYPISDAAAIAFGRVLYHRLSVGDALEAAVTEARLAVARLGGREGGGSCQEWVTPVLYLNGWS